MAVVLNSISPPFLGANRSDTLVKQLVYFVCVYVRRSCLVTIPVPTDGLVGLPLTAPFALQALVRFGPEVWHGHSMGMPQFQAIIMHNAIFRDNLKRTLFRQIFRSRKHINQFSYQANSKPSVFLHSRCYQRLYAVSPTNQNSHNGLHSQGCSSPLNFHSFQHMADCTTVSISRQ